MNTLFARWKKATPGAQRSATVTPLVVPDDDIPRYPPFAKGLPAASTARVMHTQHELIRRIRGALRFNQAEFEEIALPVIERYAAYVHLLPASEAHHHRGAGGLFRHGLEVAFWGAQRAESAQFCIAETPQGRRDNEPRWQFAALLGGLLHDVGKPLSDVAVTDKAGKKEWNPYETSLAEWAHREGVDHYFLRWRDKRNKRHEKFSMMNLDQIITPKAKSYLNKPGPHITEALLEAIAGTGASEPVTQLVMWADQESVRRDLLNQRLDVDEFAYGVPVERFIFDALRRLVAIAKVNEPGAHIWRLQQGVFLAWNHIVAEVHDLIDKDKIPGVPRNPDTLADILIERGFAVPYRERPELKPLRYWRVFPEMLRGVSLNCLRLDDLELIFTNEPPSPVRASLGAPPQAPAAPRAGIAGPTDPREPPAPPPPEADVIPREETDAALAREAKSDEARAPPRERATPNHTSACQPKPATATDTRMTDRAARAEAQTRLDSRAPTGAKEVSERRARIKAAVPRQAPKRPAAPPSPGWSIVQQAIDGVAGHPPVLVRLPDGDFAIPYPGAAGLLGNPREVMMALADEGLLRRDQTATGKTIVVAGKKYLVLNASVSRIVQERCHGAHPEAEAVAPIVPAAAAVAGAGEERAAIASAGALRATAENAAPASTNTFARDLIAQIEQGYGPFIAGEVTSRTDGERIVYRVPIESIAAIAKALDRPTVSVRMLLQLVPGVRILSGGSVGNDCIEWVAENAA